MRRKISQKQNQKMSQMIELDKDMKIVTNIFHMFWMVKIKHVN